MQSEHALRPYPQTPYRLQKSVSSPKIIHLIEAGVKVKGVNKFKKNITSIYPGSVLDNLLCLQRDSTTD